MDNIIYDSEYEEDEEHDYELEFIRKDLTSLKIGSKLVARITTVVDKCDSEQEISSYRVDYKILDNFNDILDMIDKGDFIKIWLDPMTNDLKITVTTEDKTEKYIIRKIKDGLEDNETGLRVSIGTHTSSTIEGLTEPIGDYIRDIFDNKTQEDLRINHLGYSYLITNTKYVNENQEDVDIYTFTKKNHAISFADKLAASINEYYTTPENLPNVISAQEGVVGKSLLHEIAVDPITTFKIEFLAIPNRVSGKCEGFGNNAYYFNTSKKDHKTL